MKKLLKKLIAFNTLFILITIISLLSLILSYVSPNIKPNSISILPFFGLAYLPIFFINLFLLIIWIIKRSRWSIIILITILLGGKFHFRTFCFGFNQITKNSNLIKIMSYNVHLFDLYNDNINQSYKNKNKIIEYVKKQNPDIICFQEFYDQDPPSSFRTKDTIIEIMDIKYIHEQFAKKNKQRQKFGVTIFSKYPIIKKGKINFKTHKWNYNYCIYADIIKKTDTFRVYNVHLQSIRLEKEDYEIFNSRNKNSNSSYNIINMMQKMQKAYSVRAKQVDMIKNHIINSHKKNIIICGDFNDTPTSYCYNQFNSILTDAYRNTSFGIGSTYADIFLPMRIDYIFHSENLGSQKFNVQKNKLSDHYAIDCNIYIKN